MAVVYVLADCPSNVEITSSLQPIIKVIASHFYGKYVTAPEMTAQCQPVTELETAGKILRA